MIMNELSKINLTKRLDLSHTDFRNEGHALHFHANSFEIVFYDKLKDMQQSFISEKRAIEFDCCIQYDFYKEFLEKNKKEVIRMEVRLVNKRKIRDLMNKIHVTKSLTFSNLMNSGISRSVLYYYWKKITDDLLLFSFDDNKPEDLYHDILLNNNLKPNMALKLLGSLMLIDSSGVRGFRALIESSTSTRNSQRLIRTVKKLKLKKDIKYRAISYIDKILNEFERLCSYDYIENT